MTIWALWSTLISALLAVACLAGERIADHLRIARRFLWVGAMLTTLVVSVAIALRPAPRSQSVPQPIVLDSRAVSPPLNVVRPTFAAPSTPRERPIASVSSVAQRIVVLADEWMARAWLLGSFVWLVFLAHAVVRLHRRRGEWREFTVDGSRVCVAPDVGPAVVGVLRPRIVVPQWALDLDPPARALLLRHESEHVRAGDTRLLFLAALMQLAFPWNGALWLMARRLRLAIEIDCDQRVIRAVGGAHTYGLMLLAVGERYATGMLMSAALSERRTFLETRIDVMTTPRHKRPMAASLPFAGLALLVLAAAAWTPLPAPTIRRQHQIVAPIPTIIAPVIAMTPTLVRPSTQTVERSQAVPKVKPQTIGQPSVDVSAITSPTATPAVAEPRPVPGNPAPRYPDSLRTAGVEGSVTLKFTTDARGIPDTSTIQIVAATHPQFEQSVRRALQSWRFDSPGAVRMAVRFLSLDTEQRERTSVTSPAFTIDGVSVLPAVVVSAMSMKTPPTYPPSQSNTPSTPATRAFDVFLTAFNSVDTLKFVAYVNQHLPAQNREGMRRIREQVGGYDLLMIGQVEELNLDFAARERRTGDIVGGYFSIRASDTTQVEMLRAFLAQGRALAEAATRARDYQKP